MNQQISRVESRRQPRPDYRSLPNPVSERRELVRSLVENGHLLPEIIGITGASGSAVRGDLRFLGVDIAAVSARNDRLEKNRDAIIPLANSGMTVREIAAKIGLSELQVQLASERYQIDISKPVLKYNQHGNAQAYNNGCRCHSCVDFNTARRREYRKRLLDRPIPEEAHGTTSGYQNWSCRCDRCKEAGAAYNAAQYFKGRTRKTTRTLWTKEEDQMVLNYSLSANQLAAKLGRTASAVSQRRSTLRKAGHEIRS